MGSNMAECHPVAFRWPMKAKLNGAKLVHVDPRFTRTTAAAGATTQDLIAKRAGPPFDDLVRSLKLGPAEKDPTLQNPHCVFQILKRHFARYTPEMVEQVCGSPKEKFIKVAELLLENSGRDRTSAFASAV